MAEGTTGRSDLKTVEKAFQIVTLIQENNGARISEIASELEVPKSTVHRHVSTLNNHGYLVQEGEKYYVGLRFLDHGIHARNREKAYPLVREVVDELASETGDRVQFICEEQGKGIHIYNKVGEHAMQTDTRIGKQIYLHSAAAGKAILAELPDEQVSEVITKRGLPALTSRTITDETRLLEELEEVEERGVAFNDQERIEGLRSVGIPIIGTNDRLIGAVSISGTTHRMSGDRYKKEIPDHLLGITDEIRLKLEYSE
ncbi:IclR family transcriptional regulator [Halosolutus halophilus]|uniref:IclR family transcriptional regulator n=1 Tax=Halosolutus halophilus TaxID=1552990 RepID=UPI0022352CC9|nr:IclR family transcriptional regulator [Halosolutus halophilus]